MENIHTNLYLVSTKHHKIGLDKFEGIILNYAEKKKRGFRKIKPYAR